MNKTAVLITIIIVGASIIGFQMWVDNNRFYIVSGSDGAAYEVDKKTGNTWYIRGAKKILQDTPRPEVEKRERELPLTEICSFCTGDE